MRIGIDARFVGPQGTGLGKYTEKLIENLAKIDHLNQYAIFLRKDNWNWQKLPSNFQKILADVPWYSLTEQAKLPRIFASQNLDLLHVPHFNVPLFYSGKFVVTIHDLIHHEFDESAATTRNPLIFKIKKLGYQIVINHAVQKSTKILVPSTHIRQEIIKTFKINSQKVVVTYEAAEEEYFLKISNFKFQISNYLVYVGNAYPHKNLNALLDAFKLVIRSSGHQVIRKEIPDNLKLVIVCPRDVFSQRLRSEIRKHGLEDRVELKGYLKPVELAKLFRQAAAYVFPSLSEGFGIPGLNAMATGLPVVCSNIPTLKEVYGDAAFYFDPHNPRDIAEKIRRIISDNKIRSDLIKKGRAQVQKYSWQKMAQETLAVYNEATQR